MTSKPLTAKQRKAEYIKRQAEKMRIRREYYATEQEHQRLKDILREMRETKGVAY